MTGIGIVLALVLLLALAAGLAWAWRQPYIGLGLVVAGLAFHSFALMVLLRLGTPNLLVRAFQGWKELLLALVALIALLGLYRDWRAGKLGRPLPADWFAIGLAILVAVYFLLPGSILHSNASLAQRAVGFRIDALIPLLYFIGRRIKPRPDMVPTVIWLCLGAGAVVTLFGLAELWLIPTATWLDWGVNLYTSFLGFTYHGPGGLPENFFLTLPDGTLVRRMVSTYVSPLGIAYTALLLLPLGVALLEWHAGESRRPRWLAGTVFTFVLIGLLLSVTRLALLAAAGEAALLFLLLRRRWLAGLFVVLAVGTALMLYVYPSIGPSVGRNLVAGSGGHGQAAVSGGDTSTQEHFTYLIGDLKIDLQHPLGLGTGASTVRYGQLVGTGESAVLGFFGDLGVLGGLLYTGLYLLVLWNGWRAFRRLPQGALESGLPLVALVGGLALAPITMTSDVWGDLSVTVLFWWAAGAAVTLATAARAPQAGLN
ncbi:MAG TPA: hypothetical protein VNG93_08450 [Candidatus Dormibacteraeota bacterium]|nr:hypothetical protein [Candidatus Dormibacteraeota bacterium]